jgi:acyl transferase domain-containing protein
MLSLTGCHEASSCNTSLATAVNLVLVPMVSMLFARAGMLSTDGQCKTFDARANGYVRGEGVGASALNGLDGKGPCATLSACAVRADGKSAGLTAPNGTAQARMIAQAVLNTTGSGARETYRSIEAHGTGGIDPTPDPTPDTPRMTPPPDPPPDPLSDLPPDTPA